MMKMLRLFEVSAPLLRFILYIYRTGSNSIEIKPKSGQTNERNYICEVKKKLILNTLPQAQNGA